MNNETFYFPSADGISRIFAQRWLPAGPPRAIVQIIHGASEHSARYSEFAGFLTQAGLGVAAHDHIGHGKSVAEGQRFCFFAEEGGWDMALTDINQLHVLTQKHWPYLPYFMLGHSMGSFLLRSYLFSKKAAALSGAIICGSGNFSLLRKKIAELLIKAEKKRLGAQGISPLLASVIQGGYNRQFRPNRTAADWLSSDNLMVDEYLADPFCRKLPTVGLNDDINRSMASVRKLSNILRMDKTVPLLLISGDNDPLGANGRAVRKLYAQLKKAGCVDVNLRLYPGCRHALLHERNRQEVFADITEWLNRVIQTRC